MVVETAVNPAHGAATGNTLCTDTHARLADAGLRRLCMTAAQLAAEPDPCASRLFAVRPSPPLLSAVVPTHFLGSLRGCGWFLSYMHLLGVLNC